MKTMKTKYCPQGQEKNKKKLKTKTESYKT